MNPKTKKAILIVGGAGFIGSHTAVEVALAGYEPIIVDNFANSSRKTIPRISKICGSPVKLVEGDACDEPFMQKLFKRARPIAGVIHFAAFKAVGESVSQPLKYYTNNLNSLVVLLKAMGQAGVANLVFSSSCTVYGQPDRLPVTENCPIRPAESPYGNTKKISEEIIQDTVRSGANLKCIALRYFNPIGAHSSALIGELPVGIPNNLVPFITQTAAGLREKLTVFGNDYDTKDGTCIRDYIHVVDLAGAHVSALVHLEKLSAKSHLDAINVGTGRGNSVLEVIKAFEEATGVKLKFAIGPRRAGDIVQIYANADKAKRVLGWEAKLTLRQAMLDAWKWQQALGKK